MDTKKILLFLFVLSMLLSCKKELVKTPNHLIEKDKMVNIMYDLSLLEAIKIQNPSSLDTFNIYPNDYIFKKYKIDSLQFAQSNIFYAADYKEYKMMFEKIKARLDKNKSMVESLIKSQKKKDLLLKKKKEKLKIKREADSIKKVKKEFKKAKEANSIKKVKKELKIAKEEDSIKKIKKRKLSL
jgi:thioester reductase-like protein